MSEEQVGEGLGADGRGQRILQWTRAHREEMVDFVCRLAGHESPTDVPESQEGVQRILTRALEGAGYRARLVPGRETGGHLYLRPRERTRGRPAQLLMGHSDTVWPLGTLEDMPVVHENGEVRGPGTFDMKGGLTQAVFALRAVSELGLDPPATPVLFVNSDEETGSDESKRWVRMLARRVARVFVLEPALGAEGRIKTARKGVCRYTVTLRGRAAHSGLDPTAGASAIQELSHVIQRLHALTDLERGVTVNVGVVSGGTRANVIAGTAVAEVDVRMATSEDAQEVDAAVRELEAVTEGVSLEVEGGMQAPPMERTPGNRTLWEQAREAGKRLGLELSEGTSGGGSDGNTTSQFTATLDGLGPVGDGAHARHEHLRVDDLVERTALLVELLMAPVKT